MDFIWKLRFLDDNQLVWLGYSKGVPGHLIQQIRVQGFRPEQCHADFQFVSLGLRGGQNFRQGSGFFSLRLAISKPARALKGMPSEVAEQGQAGAGDRNIKFVNAHDPPLSHRSISTESVNVR
jgi:hypothetical protein